MEGRPTKFKPGHKRRGGIIPLFAVALGVLMVTLSLTVDYGHLVVCRWKLQTAVDAGALAGGRELVSPAGTFQYTDAERTALEIAAHNIQAGYSVNFPSDKSCVMNGELSVPLLLGSFFGYDHVTVSARASAELSGITASSGIRPFGMEDPTTPFIFGEAYLLKLGPHDDNDDGEGDGYTHHGNFHAVAIGGTGGSNYRNNIKYGSDERINVGDWIDTEPGNMAGPTDQGVDYILQQEIIEEGVEYIMDQDQIAWEWYAAHPAILEVSPRLVTVPVIGDWSGVYGRSEVQVVGFASFFLEGTEGKGKDCRVVGRFVESFVPGATGGGGAGYGAYTVRLIE